MPEFCGGRGVWGNRKKATEAQIGQSVKGQAFMFSLPQWNISAAFLS